MTVMTPIASAFEGPSKARGKREGGQIAIVAFLPENRRQRSHHPDNMLISWQLSKARRGIGPHNSVESVMVMAVNGHVFHGRPIIVLLHTASLSLPFLHPRALPTLASRYASNWKRSYFSALSRFSFSSHAASSVVPPDEGPADERRDFLLRGARLKHRRRKLNSRTARLVFTRWDQSRGHFYEKTLLRIWQRNIIYVILFSLISCINWKESV